MTVTFILKDQKKKKKRLPDFINKLSYFIKWIGGSGTLY